MTWTFRDYLEMGAILAPVVAAAVMWWLSRRFAAKGSVAALARKADEIEQRLNDGDTRFTRLEASIREVETAAGAAKLAADEAAAAAERIHDVQLGMERLAGEIKALNAQLEPVAYFGRRLLEGHLKIGDGK